MKSEEMTEQDMFILCREKEQEVSEAVAEQMDLWARGPVLEMVEDTHGGGR
jgi:hypothetical protein